MIDNNDWLSRQIGLDAVNAFLEENSKTYPGDDLTLLKEYGEPFKYGYTFLKPDGTKAFNRWYKGASFFEEGLAYVEGLTHYNSYWMDAEGVRQEPDEFHSDRKVVYESGNKYHFVDREGNQIGKSYYVQDYFSGNYDFVDDYAVAWKSGLSEKVLIDKNGNEIPEEKDDIVLYNGNIGYGFYLTGDILKIRGIKLKDAHTGITIDRFQDYNGVKDGIGFTAPLQGALLKYSRKQLPCLDYNLASSYQEVGKQNGVLFFGDYWFIGPSNMKVIKDGNRYHSISEFGEFTTNLPPVKALNDNYMLCAHDNAIYVYDKKNNVYGKSCSRKDVEDLIRRKNAEYGYEKIGNAYNALANYLKMNPGADVEINIPLKAILCYPAHREKGKDYFEIQPVILKHPEITKYIMCEVNAPVIYNGERTSLISAFRDLQNKAEGMELGEIIDLEELTSGRNR